MSLRELMARIDSTDFIQVHRSVMVNANAILSATRDENGHYSLAVRGLQRPLEGQPRVRPPVPADVARRCRGEPRGRATPVA